jgi:hypothetical protein
MKSKGQYWCDGCQDWAEDKLCRCCGSRARWIDATPTEHFQPVHREFRAPRTPARVNPERARELFHQIFEQLGGK